MADEIPDANLITITYDPDSDRWVARIGSDEDSVLAISSNPSSALLALAKYCRASHWPFDPTWPVDVPSRRYNLSLDN